MIGRPDADVLIVGSGPVGLVAAIEARMAGLSVITIEPRTGPIDKACGEGVMPGAVAALQRLGVHPAGRVISGFRYQDARRSVKYRFRGSAGLGVRRTTLHAALSARAAELGVETVAGSVREVEQDEDGVRAAGVHGSWLLGADGLHSAVRRLVGLERAAAVSASRRYGQTRHFQIAPWTDVVEVHWGSSAEVYVTPVADDLVGVAVLGTRGVRYADALAGVPTLAERLDGAEAEAPVRGSGPLRQRTRARTAGRVLLVGDASGYVDALTGEGLRVGFAQAAAAIEAIRAGDAAHYERQWRIRTRDFRALTGGLLALATSPLRPGIVPVAAAAPVLFGAAIERLAR